MIFSYLIRTTSVKICRYTCIGSICSEIRRLLSFEFRYEDRKEGAGEMASRSGLCTVTPCVLIIIIILMYLVTRKKVMISQYKANDFDSDMATLDFAVSRKYIL